MICCVAGMNADASILVNHARLAAQDFLKTYNEDIPCEQLIRHVCNHKQGYTQFGGLRPFGVSFLYAGFDDRFEFQLYTSNPSGNYSGWKLTSIGANSASLQTLLKQDYKDDLTIEEAKNLLLKILSKTMDSSKLKSDKIEFATIHKSNDKIIQKIYTPQEIELLIKESGLVTEEEEWCIVYIA